MKAIGFSNMTQAFTLSEVETLTQRAIIWNKAFSQAKGLLQEAIFLNYTALSYVQDCFPKRVLNKIEPFKLADVSDDSNQEWEVWP